MNKTILMLFILISQLSCKKDTGPSDSIYGIYFYDGVDEQNWFYDLLASYDIKVSPVNSSYIEIIINSSSPAFYYAYDSVMLNGSSFTVNEMVQEGALSPHYIHSIGSGHFDTKKLSLDFILQRDSAGPHEHIVITNAKKVRDE